LLLGQWLRRQCIGRLRDEPLNLHANSAAHTDARVYTARFPLSASARRWLRTLGLPMPTRGLIFALFCLLALPALAAEPQAKRITGIYSNLTYNQESGDLLGMELLVVPSRQNQEAAYSVFVQISEGGAPFTAVVPLKVTGTNIEFTLPPGSTYPGERFVGTFKGDELLVRWSQGTVEHLKHGNSYWQ